MSKKFHLKELKKPLLFDKVSYFLFVSFASDLATFPLVSSFKAIDQSQDECEQRKLAQTWI